MGVAGLAQESILLLVTLAFDPPGALHIRVCMYVRACVVLCVCARVCVISLSGITIPCEE